MKRKNRIFRIIVFSFLLISFASPNNLLAQERNKLKNIPVYVDKEGIIRWSNNNKEASFFGVNYTVPFAYGYRSHKTLGVDLEKSIQQDVYHMARLGFDAFRVHVWDVEISDSLGNLLVNEHLRLFDFLVAKLKKRNIKILITPIAYWGSGYPEPDVKTIGFSSRYNKQQSVTNENAIAAQENYIKQFFNHVNPYTNTTYGNDPDVIAMEINNEPHHSGPKEKATEYVNRMAAAVRSTGWQKPVFYNISESPSYADAIAKANVDGHSFQWYPTSLVANYTLQGNFLPNVDRYFIPFSDTIAAFRYKARMVYEFDAGDVYDSYIYPAMARSFRMAGFQWATQFAYDPLATAYGNTEYQTHYVNLAYTPSKAISLMIAGEVFRRLPRLKSYGIYPADSVFEAFRVSYRESLSEMNTEEKFYYSNTTTTKPRNVSKLKHIAGVGSSPMVNYQGTGAYFLDKIKEGVWRLEVMPDVVLIRDPFEKASPKKEVTRIQWENQKMQLLLPEFSKGIFISGKNDGNAFRHSTNSNEFSIQPGTYIISNKDSKKYAYESPVKSINISEFVAPKPAENTIVLKHEPYRTVSPNHAFIIKAKLAGIDSGNKVTLFINKYYGGFKNIVMKRINTYDYESEIPAEFVTPGLLMYRIVIQKGSDYTVFPGQHKGNPFAWDNYVNETWQTIVATENSPLQLFNPLIDKRIKVFPAFRRDFKTEYITSEQPGSLNLHLSATSLSSDPVFGLVHFIGDRIQERQNEISNYNVLIIRVRTGNETPINMKVNLISKDGVSFAALVPVTNSFKDIEIPLNSLRPDSSLLMPRPYPGFQPLWFKPSYKSIFQLKEIEKLEVTVGSDLPKNALNEPYSLEIETVLLKQKK